MVAQRNFFGHDGNFFVGGEFFCWGCQEKVLGSSNFFCAAQKKSSTRRTFSAHPTKIFAWAEKIGDTLAKFPSDGEKICAAQIFFSSRPGILQKSRIFSENPTKFPSGAPIFSEPGEKKSEPRPEISDPAADPRGGRGGGAIWRGQGEIFGRKNRP